MQSDKRFSPPPAPEVVEWQFVKELKKDRDQTVAWTVDQGRAGDDELDLRRGIAWCGRYDDPQGRLQTAVNSLMRFLDSSGLNNRDGIPFTAQIDSNLEKEEYRLTIEEDAIGLLSGDLEGIRRGIYRFEDMVRGAGGPFLKQGNSHKKFWVKNRISRCFFGPIKRPPLNRDELIDDVDYYPEAYLERLAYEGINGLWLTIELRNLARTSFLPPDPGSDRRIEKLRNTVEKCLRYGIKTWIFCIEPLSMKSDDPLIHKYPELKGAYCSGDAFCFCPSSDTADRYLIESFGSIFKAIPDLGGVINISQGERSTTCLSAIGTGETIDCPRCGSLPLWQILHRSQSAMLSGIRAGNPDAELISWFYKSFPGRHEDWMFELAGKMPDGVIIQYNFESGIVTKQLGKARIGADYWLSEVGPSENFIRVAERAANSGTPVSAKLQVGCSHEIATVPLVPVPSLLYRKYRYMHQLGCSHAMQCWYFGNYPGLMNRAAGWLAGDTFEDNEEDFLRRLALPEWGDAADTVVSAWQKLADAYSRYPLEILVSYYGPAHDGVVWPLWLIPALAPLAQTWLSKEFPSGDTIGECLGDFTLPEALDQFEHLCRIWDEGTAMFTGLRKRFEGRPERLRDIDLVEALQTLFRSGRNILRFYYLRFLLVSGRETGQHIWEELESLIRAEIANSRKILDLQSEDSRLGYHSESETYKVYPEKLNWRIECLEELLAAEYPATRAAFESGAPVFDIPAETPSYRCGQGWMQEEHFRWRIDLDRGDLLFRAECRLPESHDYTIIDLHLLDRAGVAEPRRFRMSPIITEADYAVINLSWGDIERRVQTPETWTCEVRVPALSWNGDAALRPAFVSVVHTIAGLDKQTLEERWPRKEGAALSRLKFANFNPRAMGRLLFVEQ